MRTCNVTFDFLWTSGDKSQRLSESSMASHEKRNYFRCVRGSCSSTITFSLKRKRKKEKEGLWINFYFNRCQKKCFPSVCPHSFFTLLSLIAVHTGNTHTGADAVNSLFFFLNTLVLTCFGNHSWDNCIGLMLISNRRVQYALTVRRKIRKLYVSNRHGRADRCLWQPVPALWPISRYLEHRCY